MKTIYILTFVLIFSAIGFGQSKRATSGEQRNIRVMDTPNGTTSELLPISVSAVSKLQNAKIGLKYFGVDDKSNISFVLILEGTKSFYQNGNRYGVMFFADDVPIMKNRFRGIDLVNHTRTEKVFRLHITTEELAWLAGAEKLRIGVFDVDTEQRKETLELSPAAFGQFKAFAKSVYLMRSAKQ